MIKRITMIWSLVKGDARFLWRALRHPQAPGWLKLGVAGLVLYVLSPIDLIPDVIPILGVVDDIVIVPLGIALAVRLIPPVLMAEFRAEAVSTARPINKTMAIFIVLLWLAVFVVVAAWLWRKVR